MMIKNIKNPSKKDIKIFAIALSVFIFIIFCVIPYFIFSTIKIWPIFIILFVLLCSFFYYKILTPIYKGWMVFGHVMGYVNTRLILFLVYMVIFFFYNIIIRLLGKDLLNRKFLKTLKTYRIKRVKDYTSNDDNLKRTF